jgi:CDP-glucose 4,6-dehydratase
MSLKLDCSKARARLNWRSRWPLEIAVGKVCAWHRAFTGGANMRDFTLGQIGEFESGSGQ